MRNQNQYRRFDNRNERDTGVIANDRIRFPRVRVQSESGEALGIMYTRQAQDLAYDQDLDLVLITDKADIPVCRITDLNKFLYQKKQQEKETAKKQRENRIDVKEVQFRPGIDTHDFEVKCNHIKKFVERGAVVRVMVRFRGRENSNTELGFTIINKMMETVSGIVFEQKPQLNGNRLIATVKLEK
jgi:translation initiation factor IF-3